MLIWTFGCFLSIQVGGATYMQIALYTEIQGNFKMKMN